MTFQAGDVLGVSWDDRPIRVLQTDPVETFYDTEMEHVGWVMAQAKTAIYYRTSTPFLQETATLTASRPFSCEEDGKFRPDLPMRLFRHQSAGWSDDIMSLIALEDNISLPARRIVIIPFGKKGAATKSLKVEAVGDNNLSLWAILEAARAAQQVLCPDVRGVGLYRSGVVGGIPSYYLWGAVDRAGHAE